MTDPLREWAREYREKLCSGDPTKTLLHFRADDFELELEKMGESVVRRCAEIAADDDNPHRSIAIAEAILREWGVKP